MARRTIALCGLLGAIATAGCLDDVFVPPAQHADAGRPSLAVQSTATRTRGRTGRHIVAFTGQVPSAFAGQVTSLGGKVQWVSSGSGLAVVSGLSDAAATTLGKQVGIQEVDLDETISLEMPKLSAIDGNGAAPASNDNPAAAARFARQWNMVAVQADVAWANGFLGSPSTVVYMLDSGIDYLHADLVGRVDLTHSTDLLGTFDTDVVTDDGDTVTVPFTEADTVAKYFPGRAAFTDLFFHGTHTGATVSSNAVRAAGVTSKTTLVAVKVCGYINECPFSSILAGVIYGADNGAGVMNLSLGGSFPRMGNRALIRLINQTFRYAHRKGVTIVVSAGNEATDLDHDGPVFDSFCDAPGVICVSATGPTADANGRNPDPNLARTGPFTNVDAPAYFTNFGRRAIDVAAPGGNSGPHAVPAPADSNVFVWAACSQTSVLIGCFSSPLFIVGAQGTSMSAPHVAGTAALLVERFGRNPDRIKERIEKTADDVATKGTAAFFGHGRINVARAVGAIKNKHGGYAW